MKLKGETIENCKYDVYPLYGKEGFSSAYTGGRFKRIWLRCSDLLIYQPSSIMDIKPKPGGYLSHKTKTNIEALRVKKGQILITCSGTIGKIALVSNTLDGCIFSHDLIRMDVVNPEDIGFIYAFLRSDVGNTLLQTNRYGAVIQHIEPHHLADIPVPNPPNELKREIGDLVISSYELRDKSNEIIDRATELLVRELHLPPFNDFKKKENVNSYNIKLSELDGRFDGSYHVPIVDAIITHLYKYSKEVVLVSDKRICNDVVLPGRFKRVYVKQDSGVKFLGGKEMNQLDPSSQKYLSWKVHKKQLEGSLGIKENSILTPARGSLGTVVLANKQFLNWAISDNIMQILSNESMCGYVYIFLNSEYGKALIQRFTYGGVVDAIEPMHIKKVQIPLLKNIKIQKEINQLALEANEMRYKAYKLEQQALKIMDEEVIFAQ